MSTRSSGSWAEQVQQVSGLIMSALQCDETVVALIEELRDELQSNSQRRPDPVM
ncbi:hypothetical protein [Pseudomonas sp. BIC9C]|uniref:hypothetical protein n=1 Tax=Pseudomonas sp. BIC9C TaxID=3078458 RepID=UPI002AD350A0|nr:hypothetical protein [Pseudomonas sp. BIC9C]